MSKQDLSDSKFAAILFALAVAFFALGRPPSADPAPTAGAA